MAIRLQSFHHHLLHLNIVSIHEAEHVDAGGLVEVDFGVAADGFGAEHAAHLRC